MKRQVTSVLIAAMLFCSSAIADTDTQDTYWFADGTSAGGKSHLTRTEEMILVTVEAANLMPGDAVTLWWVVFNNPDGCSGGVCGDDEFAPGNEGLLVAAEVAVGNASGNVVKENGTLEFGSALRPNSNDDHQVVFGAGFASDYLLTTTTDAAEVHVVVQTHGQARGGKKLRQQLSYLEANCTPSCADVQFSVHVAP